MADDTEITPAVDATDETIDEEVVDTAVGDGGAGGDDDDDESTVSPYRTAFALLFPVVGAAVMAGGVFTGFEARIFAVVGGVLGMALGLFAHRVKSPVLANVVTVLGLFAIGLILIGPSNIADAGNLASEAATAGDLGRPPIEFTTGWQAIVGWLMGIVGFATIWVGVGIEKRSAALLVPLPFAAIAGISVPDDQQVASGIVVLVLFALGLGVLSSINSFEGSERPPLSYELRKLAKSLPVIGVITVALIALSQTSFLFPDPQIDPAEEPQRPKTVPLDEVEDRVLFEVGPDLESGDAELAISGPWRMGTLSIYDGKDWRLPAVATNEFRDIPDSGIIDEALFARIQEEGGVRARFRVLGLGGTVLPGLSGSALIASSGADIAYDDDTGNVRVATGQVKSGQVYRIGSTGLPTVEELQALGVVTVAPGFEDLVDVPDPPPAVQALLDDTFIRFDNSWDRFFFLRNYVLSDVVSAGPGVPSSIPPERVQEILGDTLEASPFEIVALQALLARWAGVPARIGYGFDGGEKVGEVLEVRPKHGASFVEVYFDQYGWLPVLGKPQQAKPTVGSDPGLQQVDPSILPSNDTAVQIYLPRLLPPKSTLGKQLQVYLALLAVFALVVLAIYVVTPAVRKQRIRSRRRAAARANGPRARVALAYAEWRDHAADFGFARPNDTPLMYLSKFVEDPEHTELAWLTTRALWGDLRDECDDGVAAAAEELSRAMRTRLSSSQPGTMRAVAAVARTSIRDPYAPGADLSSDEDTPSGRRFRRHDSTNGASPAAPSAQEDETHVPASL